MGSLLVKFLEAKALTASSARTLPGRLLRVRGSDRAVSGVLAGFLYYSCGLVGFRWNSGEPWSIVFDDLCVEFLTVKDNKGISKYI